MADTSWVDRKAYPFESLYTTVPAGSLHYVDEGSGRPIVMVHGNPTWSFLYRELIKRFRDGYRCVAPDHIGFGLSDKPVGWNYLPEEHAKNLAALIDMLGLEDLVLLVQDWGGPIGLSYAVEHPDNVAGIVVMNTWAWPVDDDRYYRAFSAFMGGPVGCVLIRKRNFFARSVMRRAFGDKRKLTRAVHEQYLKPLSVPVERKGTWVFPREIIGSTPWLGRLWERTPVLEGIPARIVWGEKDIAFREKELERWEATFPQAEAVRLPNVGHYVQEEAPQALGDALAALLEDISPAGPAA